MALSILAPRAFSQSAPEGNAHPATQSLSAIGETTNPFGKPEQTTADTDQKRAFAAQVDLAPLRSLAVFHNGRAKILDTLARETVSSILGRKDFVDFKIDPITHKDSKLHYDPLFTYLDLIIDPGYYVDRPLIHVEYLPLREAYLDQLYTNAEEKEWWKRLGRLKPIDIAKASDRVQALMGNSLEAPMMRALDQMRTSIRLFEGSWQNLMMVAPTDADNTWHHLAELEPSTPAAAAVAALGEGWRARDAAKVNAAAATLAVELPKIHAEHYPTARRSLEATYNRVNAFEWGYWLYALALLTLLLAFGTGRSWLAGVGVTTLLLAIGLHAFGFVSRCIIAERFAIQNQFESMTGLSLFAAVVGTTIMALRRQWLFGAAAAGVGFMVLITATQTAIPGVSVEREAAILNTSVLLKYHVTTVLVSYGLISLGFMVSLFYLGTYYAAKLRGSKGGMAQGAMATTGVAGVAMQHRDTPRESTIATASKQAVAMAPADGVIVGASATALGIDDDALKGTARVLHDLDKAQMIVLQLAFWALGVGILLGAWWADHSWGRWWAFDPKELWALVTWLVYLVVIHVRVSHGMNRALITAWLSVLGFLVMLWTYFGVNLLLPGLHAYA